MTETAWALALAFAGDLEQAETVFAGTHDRFRAADDAPGQGGALVMCGLAHERAGHLARAAELVAAGAEVWDHHLEGHVPGWGLLAAADCLLAVGRDEEAGELEERRAELAPALSEARIA
jgi:hypothetical protein